MPRAVLAALVGSAAAWSPDAEKKAKAMLSRMTLADKVLMLHGNGPKQYWGAVGNVAANERLGIPPLVMANGPQGWGPWTAGASQGNATCWPSSLTVGATFDAALAGRWGEAMGEEFYAKATNVQLGPGLCVARVPVNGRNFEYLSGEDPFLGYTLVQPIVKGIQSKHVLANAKHWVLNNQETQRQGENNAVDERTRFEIYYPPFEGAVKAGVASFMCSYNRINGKFSCSNNETLAGDLKQRLGFQGFVMSDWGATHGTTIVEGLDMEQPRDSHFGDALQKMVEAGTIPEAAVNDSVLRILGPMYEFGVFDHAARWSNASVRHDLVTSPAHSALAREIAAAAAVVVRNDGALPVRAAARRVAVIGKQAKSPSIHGGGSGSVGATYTVTPLQGIQERAGAGVTYDDGSDPARAAAAAAAADLAVVVVGDSSSEGGDRATLALSGGQDALVRAVAAAAEGKTVAVCLNPGAVLLPWAEDVSAVLLMWMPGLEVGHALADVLWGDVNPSGRLPVTIPNRDNEVNFTAAQYPGTGGTSTYSEGLLVGYRWYDGRGVAPHYPFGHGLSYTSFTYSDLAVDAAAPAVSCTVTNAGGAPGAEVAQLYLAFPASAGEPPQQLKGFTKTAVLAPGAAARVTFPLTARDLSVWDSAAHAWAEQSGDFGVRVGASSRDIRLTGALRR